jgi:hypothetical protein
LTFAVPLHVGPSIAVRDHNAARALSVPLGLVAGAVPKKSTPQECLERAQLRGQMFCLRRCFAVGDQVVNDAGVGECGRVAQATKLVFGDLAQNAAHDLT